MALAATVASWSRAQIPSDEEIVQRVVAGDRTLFEVLMRRNNQRLYRAIRSVVPAESDVEEVMQQTYVQAFGALSGFAHTAKFSTWLIRVGLNAALSSKRRDARFEQPQPTHSPARKSPWSACRVPFPIPRTARARAS